MISRLRTLFSKKGFSTLVTVSKAVHDAFLRTLAAQDLFVIAATQSEGIDANALTRENMLAVIRAALERDRENQKTRYSLFVYEEGGRRRLPFFTDGEHAQTFCGEYSKARNRIFPFMVLQMKGQLLGKAFSSCDVVVMNDKSQDERNLSADEIAAARRMWK